MKKDIALKLKLQFEGANTVQELEEVLSEINTELEDVEEGSEAFSILTETAEKATKEVKEVNSKVKDLNGQSATLKKGMEGLSGVTEIFGGAVGDLFGKLKSAGNQMGKLTELFGKSAGTIDGSSKALRIFKIALASTGIGLIVIALGSLVSYFTKTQKGVDMVSKALAGLRAAVSVIVDRFSMLGEGLLALFRGDFSVAADTFKKAVSGIITEIQNETKAATQLETRLQALEKREISLIETQAKRRAEIERLKLESQRYFEDSAKAAGFLRKAIELEKLQTAEQISIARERAEIIKGQIGLGESLNDDYRMSAEANARVIELEAERDSKLKELTSQLRGFENAQKAATKATEEAVEYKPAEAVTVTRLEKNLQDYVVYLGEIGKQTDLALKADEAKKKRSLKKEKEIADARRAIAMNMYQNLTDAANMFFKNTEEGQKKAFEFNKLVQIADTIISTIAAAQNAFQAGSKFSLAAGIANAAIATAAGLARVEAIRRTTFQSTTLPNQTTTPGDLTQPQNLSTQPDTTFIDLEQRQQNIKVFVTETDIRNATSTVSTIYQRAIITE